MAAAEAKVMADSAAQTGGPKNAGKVVQTADKDKQKEAVVDLGTIVKRLRVSLPVLRASRADDSLRRLILSQLIQ